MIISCTSCNKKFEIKSDLIPDSGRLLVCGSCNNQWFFIKEKIQDNTSQNIEETEKSNQDSTSKNIEETEKSNQENTSQNIEETEKSNQENTSQNIQETEISNQDSTSKNIEENHENNLKKNINNDESKIEKQNNKISFNILSLLLIFIISSIAIIILADTFQSPLKFVIPNIEIILFNLYETLKDIMVFFKDLIR